MSNLIHEVRYALRQLRRSPGFTVTAVLTLALGIGATTAIFTLVYAVMLRSLPVRNPQQLYKVGAEDECCTDGGLQGNWRIFSYDLYTYFRDNTRGVESLAAFQSGHLAANVRREGDTHAAQPARGKFVSGNYFSTLGVIPFRGRAIAPADDRQGVPPVAVISYRFWQRRFALDPSVIGSTVLLNGKAVAIVGVTPPEFYGETLDSDPADLWLPLNQEPLLRTSDFSFLQHPELHWLDVVGRIAPGVSRAAVQSQLQLELRQWLQGHVGLLDLQQRAQISRQTTELASFQSGVNYIRDRYAQGIRLLMTVAGFVLLIACANLANLMLVRGMARRQQLSIRTVLGAARWLLVRQTLVESVVLAIIGGAAGLLIAYLGTRGILALAFRGSEYVPVSATPSLPVLGFALAASIVTGVVFGSAPAWFASHAEPIEALRGAGRAIQEIHSLPRRSLVILQTALSVALLFTAGMLTMSLRNLEHQRFGFATEGRILVNINPGLAGYKPQQLDSLYRSFDTRLGQLPGIVSVSYALYTPMAHTNWNGPVYIPGQPPPLPNNDWFVSSWVRVGPHHFSTIGSHILRGRQIGEEDNPQHPNVAVVNETFAKRYFKGRDAIGQHFGVEAEFNRQFEIIGVAEDTKYNDPHLPVPPMFFMPFSQTAQTTPQEKDWEVASHFATQIILRVQGEPRNYLPAVREALHKIDPNLPIERLQTFADQLSTNFNQEELLARLTSLFGLLALVLASIGLYGVTAYSVECRTSEIGIRMALGAGRAAVLKMILRSALFQTGTGLLLGLPLAWLAGREIAHQLYGVPSFQSGILLFVLAVLASAGFLAALIPARGAASIDPIQALRNE